MRYKMSEDYSFWKLARSFLHEYMPIIRNLSPNSVDSYKLSLKIYLAFIKDKYKLTDDKITFDIFKRDNLKVYIVFLKEKKLAPKTINLRITAIKSFLKYASEENFELKIYFNDACSIKEQKCSKKPIEFLQPECSATI